MSEKTIFRGWAMFDGDLIHLNTIEDTRKEVIENINNRPFDDSWPARKKRGFTINRIRIVKEYDKAIAGFKE